MGHRSSLRWVFAVCAGCAVILRPVGIASAAPADQKIVTSIDSVPPGPASRAPSPSPTSPELQQFVEQLIKETESLGVWNVHETRKHFARPHPGIAGLKEVKPAQIAQRLSERFTGNEIKDVYIRYHLIYPLVSADRKTLGPLAPKLIELLKSLPPEMTFDGRPQKRFDPQEIGERYERVESNCRVVIGFPPFERTVYAPDSFQHMDAAKRAQLEPQWNEVQQYKGKFKTILDQSAAIWNDVVTALHWNQRAYRGDVIYCLVMSGEVKCLDAALKEIGQRARVNVGTAADEVTFLNAAYSAGALSAYKPDDLKAFGRSLRIMSAQNPKWAKDYPRWVYYRRYRGLPDAVFHIVESIEENKSMPAASAPASSAPPSQPTTKSAAQPTAVPIPAGQIRPETIDLVTIDDAIRRAVAALLAQRPPAAFLDENDFRIPGNPQRDREQVVQGNEALVAWALLSAGQSHQSQQMASWIRWVLAYDAGSTYDRSMRLQMLGELPLKGWESWVRRDLNGLSQGLAETGNWGNYCTDESAKLTTTDNANGQYGVMAMALGDRLGHKLRDNVWQRIDTYWRQAQQPASGDAAAGWALASLTPTKEGTKDDFAHKVSGPMTAAGVMALSMTERLVLGKKRADVGQSVSAELQKGVRWLDENLSLAALGGNDDWYYYMWTIQNVGQATGYRTFNKIDWFRQGTAKLLNEQQPNGLWKGPKGEQVSTSFALLYLARARGPLNCKLRFTNAASAKGKAPEGSNAKNTRSAGGSWNNRPNDMFNLAEYMSQQFEVPVSWQIADIDQPLLELIETPVLYLATDKSFQLSEADIGRLREYIDAGGTLVCVPEGRNTTAPLRSMQALSRSLFPKHELTPLSGEHPVFHLRQKLKGPMPVAGVRNGVRVAMFVVQRDIGRDLQVKSDRPPRDAFDLMTNIYLYATGENPKRPRLDSDYILPGAPPRAAVSAARIKTEGIYDPEPAAMPQLKAFLAKAHGIDLQIAELAPTALKGQRLGMLTVTRSSSLAAPEAAALRKWVEGGETLWIDVAGGDPEAAQRVDRILTELSVNSANLKLVPADAPLITGKDVPGGYDVRSVPWRRFSHAKRARVARPVLQTIRLGERGMILVSRDDITCGLAGVDAWEISGYPPLYARRLIANSVLPLVADKSAQDGL